MRTGHSGEEAHPTMVDLMAVQKALLDLHNWVVGVRGGWVDPSDDERFDADRRTFGKADYIIRDWMKATGSGRNDPQETS